MQRLLPVGAAEAVTATVPLDACEACCQSFPPTEQDLNPVVAGLTYSLLDSLLDEPRWDATTRDELRVLRDRAEENIPVVLPDEDDAEPIVEPGWLQPVDVSIEEIERYLPRPNPITGRSRKWAVGVTTAPRRQSTLETTLQSLRLAGWEPPTLFVDGNVNVPPEYAHYDTVHYSSVGAWRNFYQSLRHQLEHNPEANAFMMVQDDTLFPPATNLRAYVEQLPWPDDTSIVSLYCSADYADEKEGWAPYVGAWHFGALAFIFSREQAKAFLSDSNVHAAWLDDNRSPGGVDVMIGDWAASAGVSVYRSTPSVVQHIGHVSTLWPTSRAVGLRRASSFLGDRLRKMNNQSDAK